MADVYFFDFETTGANAESDWPVQLGCTNGDGEVISNTLVDPGVPILPAAEAVHEISNEMVRGSVTPAYAVWEMLNRISADIYANPQTTTILAGYNISQFDVPILLRCYKPWFQYRVLDVLDVIYRYELRTGKSTLGLVYKDLLGEELTGAHGALQDCYGTKAILEVLLKKHNKTVDELVSELETPQVYQVMPIGKYAGFQIAHVPKSWAQWMNSNATNLRPDLEVTIKHILAA